MSLDPRKQTPVRYCHHRVPLGRQCSGCDDEQRRPPEPELVYGTCDWGYCDNAALGYRWSDEHGWLPVCDPHRDPESVPLQRNEKL